MIRVSIIIHAIAMFHVFKIYFFFYRNRFFFYKNYKFIFNNTRIKTNLPFNSSSQKKLFMSVYTGYLIRNGYINILLNNIEQNVINLCDRYRLLKLKFKIFSLLFNVLTWNLIYRWRKPFFLILISKKNFACSSQVHPVNLNKKRIFVLIA